MGGGKLLLQSDVTEMCRERTFNSDDVGCPDCGHWDLAVYGTPGISRDSECAILQVCGRWRTFNSDKDYEVFARSRDPPALRCKKIPQAVKEVGPALLSKVPALRDHKGAVI